METEASIEYLGKVFQPRNVRFFQRFETRCDHQKLICSQVVYFQMYKILIDFQNVYLIPRRKTIPLCFCQCA
jgi:hypothetical protein